jgi:hypothetical protein
MQRTWHAFAAFVLQVCVFDLVSAACDFLCDHNIKPASSDSEAEAQHQAARKVPGCMRDSHE